MKPRFFPTPERFRAWLETHHGRTAAHRVASAKRAETRDKRLAQLVASSARRCWIPPLARPGSPGTPRRKS